LSLRKKAISGVKWTSLSTIISALLQVVQVAILARFLSAGDFGLMAIVMVVIGFAQAFLDMGMSNAIIHKQEVSHRQLSTLYWLNIMAGFLLYLIVYFLAPFIASFYHESRLEDMIKLIGVIFLITPFGQQFFILLEKELKFNLLAKITILNKIISLLVTSYLAYLGFGVYALIYGAIISAIFTTSQYIMIGSKEHRPSFGFHIHEVGDFLQFGLYQMGERMINYFNSQFDTILIGKLLGVESLGIYTIAKELIMKPASIINPIFTRVAFPTMAKIQDDIPRLKDVYLKMINFIASINFPIYVAIIILAPELVNLLFGQKWMDAVPLVQILSIFGAIRSIGNPIGSLLLARGRADLGFWWNFGLLFFTPIMIYIYSYWGLTGIAWGLILNLLILQLPTYYIVIQPLCGADLKEYFGQIIKALFIAIVLYVLVYNYYLLLPSMLLLKMIVVVGSIVSLSYVLNYYLNRTFIDEVRGFMKR
jgi:O-antigen/teichoic acid export membrane protein